MGQWPKVWLVHARRTEHRADAVLRLRHRRSPRAHLDGLEKSGILPGLEARELALDKLSRVPGIVMQVHRAKEQYPAFQIGHVDPTDMPRLLAVLGEILMPGGAAC